MPRPPILPIPDRRAIFHSGLTWEAWLAQAEEPAQADRLRANYQAYTPPAEAVAALATIARPVHVIAIAESWCGDVIRHTPVLVRLLERQPLAQLRFISRAQYPDYFARFLTNGGEAIPKFVFCNHDFVEVGHWGPMSSTPRRLIAQGKACGDGTTARQRVSAFYEADQHRESTRELVDLAVLAACPGFAAA
jgi:hypothetical protein